MALVGATGKRQTRLPLSLLLPLFPEKTVESIWNWTKALGMALSDMYNKLVNRIEELIQYGEELPPSDGGRKIFWETDVEKLYMDIQTGNSTMWQLILAGSNAVTIDGVADELQEASVTGELLAYDGSAWVNEATLLCDFAGVLNSGKPSFYPAVDLQGDLGTFSNRFDAIHGLTGWIDDMYVQNTHVNNPEYTKALGFDFESNINYTTWNQPPLLSFADSTLTVSTDDGDLWVWIDGASGDHRQCTEPSTVDIPDTDSTGMHSFYFNTDPVLVCEYGTPWPWQVNASALVATAYWNSTWQSAITLNFEAHSKRIDKHVRDYMRDAHGVLWVYGYEVTTPDNVTLDVSSGELRAEDIEIGTAFWSYQPSFSPWTGDVLYRSGTEWVIAEDTSYPVIADGSGAYANVDDGMGGMTLSAIGLNNYVAYWVIGSTNLNCPIVCLVGTQIHGALDECRTGNDWSTLGLDDNFPLTSYKPLARLLVQETAVDPYYSIVEINDYREGNPVIEADTLDGQHGSYYLDAANQSGVLSVPSGGTGQSAFATGEVIFGADTAALSTDSTFIFSGGALYVPEIYVGDASHYTHIDSAGHQTMVGNAQPWDDLRIEPVARTTGTNAPSFERWYSNGGSRGVYLYSFDDAVTASEKEVHFTMQMPHDWNNSTIHIHVHWVPSHSDTGATPRWGLEYNLADIGTVFTTPNTIYATGNVQNDTDLTAHKHYITEFTDIVPTTSYDDISMVLIGRLFRNSSDAADTYDTAGNKCGLLYIDAHYQRNSIGSDDEYQK